MLTEEEASIHFGDYGESTPVCIIHGSTAHGLAVKVRELEKQIVDFHNESDPVSRYWYDLQAKHHREIIDAEQKGYDKGLNDGREHYKTLIDKIGTQDE